MQALHHAASAACIAGGAVLGALSRYALTGPLMGDRLGTWAASAADGERVRMPWAVLIVNLAGCLVVGVVAALLIDRPAEDRLRLLIVTGFLGSFTTFSAFGLDTLELLRAGEPRLAALYAGLSVIGGVALAAAGWSVGAWCVSGN